MVVVLLDKWHVYTNGNKASCSPLPPSFIHIAALGMSFSCSIMLEMHILSMLSWSLKSHWSCDFGPIGHVAMLKQLESHSLGVDIVLMPFRSLWLIVTFSILSLESFPPQISGICYCGFASK